MKYNLSYNGRHEHNITENEYLGIFLALDSNNLSDISLGTGVFAGIIHRIINSSQREFLNESIVFDTNLYVVMFCFLRKYLYGKVPDGFDIYYTYESKYDMRFAMWVDKVVWNFTKTTDPETQSKLIYILREVDITSLDNLQLYEKIENLLNNAGCRYPSGDDLAAIRKLI